MATQQQADATLAFHEDDLFNRIPNLAKLSVVKNADGEWIIEAGVIDMNMQLALKGTPHDADAVPDSLEIPDAQDAKKLTRDLLPVSVVYTGEIQSLSQTTVVAPLAFTNRVRPVNGGSSVGNCRYNSAGTFGSVVRLKGDTTNRYFLSNWHVLVGGSGRIGDPLLQPGRLDGGVCSRDRIGVLHWHLLDGEFDAALGRSDMPWANFVAHGFRCYSSYNATPQNPTNGAAVTKCGRTTEQTSGTIRSTNATARVSGYPSGVRTFRNQIETTSMASPGDSGSITFETSGMKAVGLLFAGGSTRTYHNKLKLLFDRHFNTTNVTNANGESDDLPELQIESLGEK